MRNNLYHDIVNKTNIIVVLVLLLTSCRTTFIAPPENPAFVVHKIERLIGNPQLKDYVAIHAIMNVKMVSIWNFQAKDECVIVFGAKRGQFEVGDTVYNFSMIR